MTTRRFAFEDDLRLHPGEREGGTVFLTGAAESSREPPPILVFLHGINEHGPLHRGFGGGPFDLRPTLDALGLPLAAVAPSQTRDAARGARLFANLDLAALVAAAERAAERPLDRTRVIVAAHSGGGCNVDGGLFSPRGDLGVLAFVALDTCLDERFGARLAQLADVAPVYVEWQPGWTREVDACARALDGRATITRHDALGEGAHDAIVPIALARLLPVLLAAQGS